MKKKYIFLTVKSYLVLQLWILCLLGCCFPTAVSAATETAQSNFIPWSGWWWPTNMGGLATGADYKGHPAPLEKYDLLLTGQYPGSASQYYLENDYNPDAVLWSGLCHAWAAASVYEKFDFFPSSVDNIIFNIGDKKGLLTLCHNHDQRLYGNTDDPAVFHLWLLKYIKDEGQAFYAELDPSEEVWNFPIYRYEMDTVDADGAVTVTCKIWYASDFVHPDFNGTDPKTEIYTYSLFFSGNDITGGQWTGNSVINHPQVLSLPVGLGTFNPYLDYGKVKEIAVSKDDPLESEEPTELYPGGYNLMLLNDDVYRVSAAIGEYMFLSVEKKDDLQAGMYFSVTDNAGQIIRSVIVSNERSEFNILSENPPYTVTISRPAYDDAGVYRLEFDLKKAYSFYNPDIQKGFGWGGFAITNPGPTDCETVFVTGYGRDGSPIETYVGPFSLSIGQKKIVQASDFRVRMIERDELYGVKVQASQPIQVLNLTGYFGKNMSAMGKAPSGDRFVVPEIQVGFNLKRTVNWGLYNSSLEKTTIVLSHFAGDGSPIDSSQSEFLINELRHYSGHDYPFGTAVDGGWVLIEPHNGARIGGYWQWMTREIDVAESLPMLGTAREFAIPHVADLAEWKTNLVLINTEASSSQVRLKLLKGAVLTERELNFSAREKKTFSIAALFPDISTEILNQCAISISASGQMAGYYTFETGMDSLFFPLPVVANAKRELTVPHVASNSYWWTCVNLLNYTESQDALISLVPYGNDGNMLAGGIREKTIGALSKEVFTVDSIWKEEAGQIASIRIIVKEGPPVVGIFAYGNSDFSMLAGDVFN